MSADYTSPVDFQFPSETPDVPPQFQGAVDIIWRTLLQFIRIFIGNCGVGPQNRDLWPQLDGSVSGLLGGQLQRFYCTAKVNIAANRFVSFFDDGGQLKAQYANATDNTKPARGYSLEAVNAGEVGAFFLTNGVIPGGGLTKGANYFLATTDGVITAVAPVAAGNIEQYVGWAVDADNLYVNMGYWIQH